METRNNKFEMERRVFAGELRAEPDSRAVEGYAAVYGSPTDLGWFSEEIAPGAFDGADMKDARALFNHNDSAVLARFPGTLQLTVDERGLKYRFEAPNTTTGNDLLEMLRRGDINQSSFAFTIQDDEWHTKDGKDHRTIKKIKRLYDVSPVTFPAYADTSVALRSREHSAEYEQRTKDNADLRARFFEERRDS